MWCHQPVVFSSKKSKLIIKNLQNVLFFTSSRYCSFTFIKKKILQFGVLMSVMMYVHFLHNYQKSKGFHLKDYGLKPSLQWSQNNYFSNYKCYWFQNFHKCLQAEFWTKIAVSWSWRMEYLHFQTSWTRQGIILSKWPLKRTVYRENKIRILKI